MDPVANNAFNVNYEFKKLTTGRQVAVIALTSLVALVTFGTLATLTFKYLVLNFKAKQEHKPLLDSNIQPNDESNKIPTFALNVEGITVTLPIHYKARLLSSSEYFKTFFSSRFSNSKKIVGPQVKNPELFANSFKAFLEYWIEGKKPEFHQVESFYQNQDFFGIPCNVKPIINEAIKTLNEQSKKSYYPYAKLDLMHLLDTVLEFEKVDDLDKTSQDILVQTAIQENKIEYLSNFKVLNLNHQSINDDELIKILDQNPRLEQLDISNCKDITSKGFKAIIRHHLTNRSLKALTLSLPKNDENLRNGFSTLHLEKLQIVD
ncbi:MAG: hypothetical protein BGO10_01225 [Chlamydia sp. 32-24]|nr:MAG: hypothetical protein BGO10_01225 [Chlamydia sp. 32-24]